MSKAHVNHFPPAIPTQKLGYIRVLTPSQLERFNKTYNDLKGEEYLRELRKHENQYGYWDQIAQFN